jgi:phage FluMu protein Com
MDRCPHCNKRMKTVLGDNGRTEFKCLRCDDVDPLQTDAARWAESPLARSGSSRTA